MSTIILSNPPKSARSKRRRTTRGKSRRKAAPMAKRRKGGGKRRGGGRRGRRSGGFATKDIIMTGAFAVGGIIAANMILPRVLPADMLANPLTQAGALAGVGIVGGMLLRRVSPQVARGLALGGVIAGGTAAATHFMQRGTSGLGLFPVFNRQGQPTLTGGMGGVGNNAAWNMEYATN